MSFSQYKFKFYLNASHAITIEEVLGERHPHTWEIAIHTVKKGQSFIEFHKVEAIIDELLEPYQDGYLNQIAPFTTINPTLENCCFFFQKLIQERLEAEGWELLRIEMSETPTRTFVIDLHDVSVASKQTLQVGAVISDEPGLYIDEWGIGIRIEDDLLITKEGCVVLSEDIIRDPDEIEAFMKEQKY